MTNWIIPTKGWLTAVRSVVVNVGSPANSLIDTALYVPAHAHFPLALIPVTTFFFNCRFQWYRTNDIRKLLKLYQTTTMWPTFITSDKRLFYYSSGQFSWQLRTSLVHLIRMHSKFSKYYLLFLIHYILTYPFFLLYSMQSYRVLFVARKKP